MKLKSATYKHIEAEIFEYNNTLKAIEEIRRDIILAGRSEDSLGLASGSTYSNSTVERRGTRLADHGMLREMERITGAIADTYKRTKDEARRIIWLKYGLVICWVVPDYLEKKLGDKNRFSLKPGEMAELLSIDESTFHRYRTGFVHGIAERLGWY